MPTTEEWIAIATIATGAVVSVWVVVIGYYLQTLTLRRERLLELTDRVSRELYALTGAAFNVATVAEIQTELSGWTAPPPLAEIARLSGKIQGVASTGGAAVPLSTAGPVSQQNLASLWQMLGEATSRVNSRLNETLDAVRHSGTTLTLIRKDLSLGPLLTGFANFVLTKAYGAKDWASIEKELQGRVQEIWQQLADATK